MQLFDGNVGKSRQINTTIYLTIVHVYTLHFKNKMNKNVNNLRKKYNFFGRLESFFDSLGSNDMLYTLKCI